MNTGAVPHPGVKKKMGGKVDNEIICLSWPGKGLN